MITLKNGSLRLLINPLGGGIARFYRETNGKIENYIYGYKSEEEKTGSMGDVLFPFPGRVKNCRYSFQGKDYILSGLRIKDGHANHGFAKQSEWKILEIKENEAKLCFKMKAEDYINKGFPFSLNLTLTYQLNDDGFICRAEVENFGQTDAPFGLGFHPYFKINDSSADDMTISLPAKKMVEFKDLEPTGELLPINNAPFDSTGLQKINNAEIDNCFADLKFKNGRSETVLSNKGEEIKIWQDESFPYLQIYSADTLVKPHLRQALAIEPQTCTGFALNHPEMGLIVLEPAQKFHGSWGVRLQALPNRSTLL